MPDDVADEESGSESDASDDDDDDDVVDDAYTMCPSYGDDDEYEGLLVENWIIIYNVSCLCDVK